MDIFQLLNETTPLDAEFLGQQITINAFKAARSRLTKEQSGPLGQGAKWRAIRSRERAALTHQRRRPIVR